MKTQAFEFNLFGVNTYIVWNPDGNEAAIIDPGMENSADAQLIADFVADHNLSIKHLLCTHLHIDHTFGIEWVEAHYGVKLQAHQADEQLGLARPMQAQMFRLNIPARPIKIANYLIEGQKIWLGNDCLQVLHAPGHSPGSVLFYNLESGFVITGDVIFKNSIGRTDLPGGSHPTLVKSIRAKVLTLPENTIIYPGHGPATTVAAELRSNPFI